MGNQEVDILLVEDSIHDAELTMRALRQNNVAKYVVHLKDGATALDFLFGQGEYDGRDTGRKPKVILLDLKMPKVSGLEVLERLAANPLTASIPVVVLTSSKEHPDVEKAYRLGANSYIVKPVDFDDFRKVVSELGVYWMLSNHLTP